MRISDWSSDVCSSDLHEQCGVHAGGRGHRRTAGQLLQEWSSDNLHIGEAGSSWKNVEPRRQRQHLDQLAARANELMKADKNYMEENGRGSWKERVCQYV